MELKHPDSEIAVQLGYNVLRESCGFFVPSSALIEVRGEDRKEWLQGQATNDLRPLEVGGKVSFCLCEPTGQLVAICDLYALPDRCLLTCDASVKDAVLKRFETMVVLEDVHAQELTVLRPTSIEGPKATRELSSILHLPSLEGGDTRVGDQTAIALRQNRTGLGGWEIWSRNYSWAKHFAQVPHEAVEIARLEAGVPRIGVDVGPKVLPPELGPEFEAKHISYNKGCYTGQEVLMRIHSRGHTNRTWVGLLCESPVEQGAVVSHASREDAGVVTSGAVSPELGPIAAGFLRNEFASAGEQVSVGGVPAEVKPMPLLA